MVEIWKPIKGYEKLYEISNFGRVKTFCDKRGERLRKLVPDKNGYMTVCLKKDGKYCNKKVHRLVAEAFLRNINDFPHVNHKDLNKANNCVDNLEWCSAEYNNLYMDKYKCTNKAVKMLDCNLNVLKIFESIRTAAKAMKVNETCISMVLHGKRKTAGGYKWAFQY